MTDYQDEMFNFATDFLRAGHSAERIPARWTTHY